MAIVEARQFHRCPEYITPLLHVPEARRVYNMAEASRVRVNSSRKRNNSFMFICLVRSFRHAHSSRKNVICNGVFFFWEIASGRLKLIPEIIRGSLWIFGAVLLNLRMLVGLEDCENCLVFVMDRSCNVFPYIMSVICRKIIFDLFCQFIQSLLLEIYPKFNWSYSICSKFIQIMIRNHRSV